MKHKVSCAVCGKKGIVEIDSKTRKILSKDWCYYGKMDVNFSKTDRYFYKVIRWKPDFVTEKVSNLNYDPKANPEMVEGWECKKCNKE